MPVQKTEAIVLGYHPLGEADRIVIFCTKEFGNIRAVARGCRKVKSRLCGRLEILTYGTLVFYERADKDLHVVNSFDVTEPFQVLREELLKMAYCSYLAELIQRVEFSGDADSDTFDLMLETMSIMKDAHDPEVLVRAFEIRFLQNAGLSPQLDSCMVCSNDVGTSLKFDVARGGVLCGECKGSSGLSARGSIVPISRGTVELMKRMQRTPLKLITRLGVLETSRRELRKVLRSFISYHVSAGRLRSLDFLTSIENDKELSAAGSWPLVETS